MNTTKDQISLVCKASLECSTTNPTHLDQQKGPELHGQDSCTEQKRENFPIEQNGCRNKSAELQAECSAVGMALPPHTSVGRCSKAFLWRLAVLSATQLPYVRFSSGLEYLCWSASTEMSTPELKGDSIATTETSHVAWDATGNLRHLQGGGRCNTGPPSTAHRDLE